MSGTLYVVATPIGNLQDLTPRARETLANVSLIAAEDTRHSGRLLSHIGCKTRLLALHDHNEEQVVDSVIGMLLSGDSVALVSDAGTPLVSDPGFRLVREAHARDIVVSPIPGASAVTAALCTAGIATDRFCFEGFLPSKKVAREQALANLASEQRTLIFYESVHRIEDSVAAMVAVFGDNRQAFVGRELTKMHEQCVQASLGEIQAMICDGSIRQKGEFVVVIAGAVEEPKPATEVDRLLLLLSDKLATKDVASIVAEYTGHKKNELYERLLALGGK